MIYKKAENEDIKQLTELRIEYLTEDNGKLDKNELTAIEKNLPDYFKRNLNKNIFAYTAKSGQEIVSCALLLVIEKPMSPAFITGKTGIVLNVYTKPKSRRRGYAKKIMNMLLEDALNMELSVVELKATQDGYSLYKSLGFSDEVSKYNLMQWHGKR